MPSYYTEKELDELIARAKRLGVDTALIEEQKIELGKASGESAKRVCWKKIEEQAREVQKLLNAAEFNNEEELNQ